MEEEPPLKLFTIGYDVLSLAILQGHGVGTIVDVRDDPPAREGLGAMLRAAGICYRYAGAYLGTQGAVDFPRLMQSPTYVTGVTHLLNLLAQEQQNGYFALLGNLADPRGCHRHHLIARSLLDPRVKVVVGGLGLHIRHIRADGSAEAPLSAADFP